MNITARIENGVGKNNVTVTTEGNEKALTIPAKSTGMGSSVNGGELLFLALATCFCNDLYREAAKRKYEITGVTVTVSGNFGKEGEPASNIRYQVDVESSNQSDEEIEKLISYVDSVAEVHNTLRKGTMVSLSK